MRAPCDAPARRRPFPRHAQSCPEPDIAILVPVRRGRRPGALRGIDFNGKVGFVGRLPDLHQQQFRLCRRQRIRRDRAKTTGRGQRGQWPIGGIGKIGGRQPAREIISFQTGCGRVTGKQGAQFTQRIGFFGRFGKYVAGKETLPCHHRHHIPVEAGGGRQAARTPASPSSGSGGAMPSTRLQPRHRAPARARLRRHDADRATRLARPPG